MQKAENTHLEWPNPQLSKLKLLCGPGHRRSFANRWSKHGGAAAAIFWDKLSVLK